MIIPQNDRIRLEQIQKFYDTIYYHRTPAYSSISHHYHRLATRIGICQGDKILDVACGVGAWLLTCKHHGAIPYGIDLSHKAIATCKEVMPEHEFYVQPAEELPFRNRQFDIVSCLGALEHFIDPQRALKEMVRVAKDDATILLLVPNAQFLAYHLRLFSGTNQTEEQEKVLPLDQWQAMFIENGLEIQKKWRDLHLLSWRWLSLRGWKAIPIRIMQAFIIAVLPLRWQYQVYYQCYKK